MAISPDRAGTYRVEVFDVAGRRVTTLAHEAVEAGRYRVRWTGRRGEGRAVPPGVYFIRVLGPGVTKSAKLVVVK
jgi:flagellar hook assembly protein FlgD